jgi:hypothetical protein
MKQYKDLTEEEQKEVYNKAFTWKHDYADHVAKLLDQSKYEYAVVPSGSDLFKPELWKPCHWKWFYQNDL